MARDDGVHLWLILHRASRAIERNALNSIAALGLGLSDFAVLELLLHKGPQPVNRIGHKVLLSSGSVTTAVSRLEERGLVRRVVDPEDLRSRIVQLTEPGRRLIEKAFSKHALDIEETMSVLGARERAEMIRVLKKLGMWAAARADGLSNRPSH